MDENMSYYITDVAEWEAELFGQSFHKYFGFSYQRKYYTNISQLTNNRNPFCASKNRKQGISHKVLSIIVI